MTPGSAGYHRRNRRVLHAEAASQLCLRDAAVGPQLSDSPHGLVVKLGIPASRTPLGAFRMSMAVMSFPAGRPPFERHVVQIVRTGAKEEVVGAHATAVVAMMADIQSVGDRAIVQFIRQPMSGYVVVAPVASVVNDAIPAAGECSRPQPAAIGLLNMGPESLGWRFGMRTTMVRFGGKSAIGTEAATTGDIAPLQAGRFDVERFAAELANAVRGACAIMGLHGEPPIRCAAPRAVASSAGALACGNPIRLQGIATCPHYSTTVQN